MINTIVKVEKIKTFSEQGFFSNSYLGMDVRLNRQVAVKDVKIKGVVSEEGLEDYFEEANKLALATHPRILPVYFVGLVDDGGGVLFPRIITKYLRKGSLNGYLEECYRAGISPDLEQLIRFSHEIIQGLIHLHSLNILHLDLKASNIFIGDDDKLVIADFGLSKFINEEVLADVGHLYPVLNPPENITLKYVDKTADIYQFGVLLYSMFNYDMFRDVLEEHYKVDTKAITHLFNLDPSSTEYKELKKEFNANMKQLGNDIKDGIFPDRANFNDFVPKEIKDLIVKCLEVKVEDRYNNFYEVQAVLNKFVMPDNVSNIKNDIKSRIVRFVKNDLDCEISIEKSGKLHDLKASKNGKKQHAKSLSGVTEAKLCKAIFSIIETV